MQSIPKINPFAGGSTPVTFQTGISFPSATKGPSFLDNPSQVSFKDVMVNMVKDTDKTLSEPDELMNRYLTTGDVDIHEVMISNTKADIAVNIASQVVTKVIQAYERIQQIQV